MKSLRMVLAMGLLMAGGAGLRAGEGAPAPGTLKLTAMPADSAPACCAASACTGHDRCCLDRLCDWLHYKPVKAHCACRCPISSCWPPLYTWFTDMCPSGGCGSCGHTVSAPCGGSCCGTPAH